MEKKTDFLDSFGTGYAAIGGADFTVGGLGGDI